MEKKIDSEDLMSILKKTIAQSKYYEDFNQRQQSLAEKLDLVIETLQDIRDSMIPNIKIQTKKFRSREILKEAYTDLSNKLISGTQLTSNFIISLYPNFTMSDINRLKKKLLEIKGAEKIKDGNKTRIIYNSLKNR